MPTIQKLFVLEVTPEKFVDSCTEVELQEVILLAEKRLTRIERVNRQFSPKAPEQPSAGFISIAAHKQVPI
jgi:hypothetical protein